MSPHYYCQLQYRVIILQSWLKHGKSFNPSADTVCCQSKFQERNIINFSKVLRAIKEWKTLDVCTYKSILHPKYGVLFPELPYQLSTTAVSKRGYHSPRPPPSPDYHIIIFQHVGRWLFPRIVEIRWVKCPPLICH